MMRMSLCGLLWVALAVPGRAQCPGGSCMAPRYVHPTLTRATYGPSVPAPTPAIPGSGPGAKTWVWLTKQGLWGFGWRRTDGLWVIDPGSKRKPASGPRGASDDSSAEPGLNPAMLAPPDHRQAFLGWLNGHRAQHGLGPVGYSEDLEWQALDNSAAQARAGRSGHYGPATCWQVSFLGPANIEEAIAGWVASPSHAAALVEPSVTMVGVGVVGNSYSVNLR